ncbi:hypothetical protein IEQ34_025499 [Dendrobium chrysotoxum]|uniref:Uncharacterized protein n=1 Tax=Dendrobium chrysotoxum TaxID=161865 RepID=A0AAV7FQM6_DENCH|nr:hypothetical protein IEQ34_025499 [Dendrobium chrysotoxum]
MEMLALRSTCGLTTDQCLFLCFKGTGADPTSGFGHVPCRNWAGRKRVGLPTQSARYGRLVRSAKLSFSVPGLQPCLPPFSCLIS